MIDPELTQPELTQFDKDMQKFAVDKLARVLDDLVERYELMGERRSTAAALAAATCLQFAAGIVGRIGRVNKADWLEKCAEAYDKMNSD